MYPFLMTGTHVNGVVAKVRSTNGGLTWKSQSGKVYPPDHVKVDSSLGKLVFAGLALLTICLLVRL